MKHRIFALTAALLAVCLLAGCSFLLPPETEPTEAPTFPETIAIIQTEPETEPETQPETEPEPRPEHSDLYIPGVSVEDVITYFNEVCLDSEYVDSGDPSVVQKWVDPVLYTLYGDYTDEDLAAIDKIAGILNGIEGYPGFYWTDDPEAANLRINFWTQDELTFEMGEYVNGDLCDGIVHYWYDGDNAIYSEDIGIRTDMGQYLRNSVILEEIYNGTGATQDTMLRPDSIIYQEYSETQDLTDVDVLLMQLLYHPAIECGMNAEQCAEVIRALYY